VILHVCTGNQARSPMAELLMIDGLRRALGAAADELPVISAGTRGPAGLPIQPYAAAELGRRDIGSDRFASRLLDDHLLGRARLVLTATRRHRDQLIAPAPVVMRAKTFTWRELGWLLEGADPVRVPGECLAERATTVAAYAVGRRGLNTPPVPALMDVADPMGQGRREFHTAFLEIAEAVDRIVKVLAG
jgi:protein-tyrosine phosphatase